LLKKSMTTNKGVKRIRTLKFKKKKKKICLKGKKKNIKQVHFVKRLRGRVWDVFSA